MGVNLVDVVMPTADQCDKNVVVYRRDGVTGYAMWYPQMGGYVGMAVVFIGNNAGACFDALVWHDGNFPFDDGQNPAWLHHCQPEQFISFGETVKALCDT